MILEEGFPLADLAAIVRSMARAAKAAGVPIVTGDTKVVERGKGDGIFITTTGVGVVPDGVDIAADRARPGDAVLLSGSIGDHGTAVLSKRENLAFETEIVSDSAALHGLVAEMVAAVPGIHVMRDPTRGGLAAVLNEIARESRRRHRGARGCHPGRHRGARRLRAARPRSALRRQRGQARRLLRRRRTPSACWRRCAPIRWAATPRSSAR